MRVLVTGAEGFVGSRVAAALAARGEEVVGTCRRTPAGSRPYELRTLDVRDEDAVAAVIAAARPAVCVHLAGVAMVGAARRRPGEALATNVLGTSHLARAFGAAGGRTFVFASTARVYGRPRRAVVDEAHPVDPADPYAVSKLAAEAQVVEAARAYDFAAARLRLFNHVGPGQGPGYVVPDFAARLAAAARAGTGHLRVGDLAVRRDFTDVADVVRAYLLAIDARVSGVFNVGSGSAVGLRDVLGWIGEGVGVTPEPEVDPGLLRRGEPAEVRADPGRFARVTGWRAEIPIRETLRRVGAAAREAADAAASAGEGETPAG